MKKLYLSLIVTTLMFVHLGLATPNSVESSMLNMYEAFKSLQPYLADRRKFQNSQKSEELYQILKKLSDNMHDVGGTDSRYANLPGFSANINAAKDTLDDALNRFKEGEKEYSLWRIRFLSSHCISCHATYGVKVDFYDSTLNLDGLSDGDRGEFYLATRQFERAKDAFYSAVIESEAGIDRMTFLRKWLIIYTRVKLDPKEGLRTLSNLTKRVKFNTFEKEVINDWSISLKRWESENTKIEIPALVKAENLIRQGISSKDPLTGQLSHVEMLRATGILHRYLEDPKLSKENRGEALYLLGLTYSKIPLFFMNDNPEFFLRQCIDEMAGTNKGKQCYRVLKDLIVVGFSGSSGVNIPNEVNADLEDLYKKAYGSLTIEDRL